MFPSHCLTVLQLEENICSTNERKPFKHHFGLSLAPSPAAEDGTCVLMDPSRAEDELISGETSVLHLID